MSLRLAVPVLETPRLRLRGWDEDVFEAFAALWTDGERMRFVGGTKSRAEAWRTMAGYIGHWHLRGFGFWAVTGKARGTLLGWCGLWHPEGFPEREIGWGLSRDGEGFGYATEAAEAARRHAYGALGWPTAVSFIAAENVASRRVAERLGARRDGVAELRGDPVEVWRHPAPAALRPTI